jgi:hypothetical protein
VSHQLFERTRRFFFLYEKTRARLSVVKKYVFIIFYLDSEPYEHSSVERKLFS